MGKAQYRNAGGGIAGKAQQKKIPNECNAKVSSSNIAKEEVRYFRGNACVPTGQADSHEEK